MKNSFNVLIAAIFLVGFFFAWDALVMSRYAPPRPAKPPVVSETITGSATDPVLKPKVDEISKLPVDSTINLTADGVDAMFHSRGAKAVSWKIREKNHWLEVVMPEAHRRVAPLESFGDLNFAISKKSASEAVFTAQRADGLRIEKTISLLSKPPFHKIQITLHNNSSAALNPNGALVWGSGLDKHEVGKPYDAKDEKGIRAEMRAVGLAQKIQSWKSGFVFDRTLDKTAPGPFRWVGVDNNHFLAAFIAPDRLIQEIRVEADRDITPSARILYNEQLSPGEKRTYDYLLYVGPKEYDNLKQINYDLHLAVDFGFFGSIAKALLLSLKFFEDKTGNYGWAIILLTLCIQILMIPLTRKNFQHAARMKVLTPQIKKLQEQFKSDPKRMQIETFNLYKKNGMKFMGMEGCIPMLLQIPVFFAFYATLRVAYELRGAPWIFWIHDLGARDPYYVLPIVMGLGMFVQQKTAMVAMDPAQARIMMIMPIMMTFMFLPLPAGLVLYWCVNSLVTIAIQFIMMSKQEAPSPA